MSLNPAAGLPPGGVFSEDAGARHESAARERDAPKYWAFISYSHADEAWARWLHRSLENYRVPAKLVGTATLAGAVPQRLFPVFRDRDELAGSHELGPELERALRQSRTQIVICSPSAAKSRWVNEEIRYFKSLGAGRRVLALIVDGEPGDAGGPTDCFPRALRFQVGADGSITDEAAEPVAADARRHADGRDNAKLKLIAGVLGVAYNDLRQRELHARNRRLMLATGVASLVAVVTVVLAIAAYHARNDALRRQQQAEDLLQFMLGDLREKLEPIGKLAILDAVGQKAMDYFATLDPEDLTDTALASRAKALRQIGVLRIRGGNMGAAEAPLEEALRLDQALLARHLDDLQLNRAFGESAYSIGYAYYMKGDYARAEPWWLKKDTSAERVLALSPGDPESIRSAVEAHMNVGAVEFSLKNWDRSQRAFEDALRQQQALLARDKDNPKYLITLAAVQGWLSYVAASRGDWPGALDHAQLTRQARRQLLDKEPDNAEYRLGLAEANQQALYAQWKLKPIAPDSPLMTETERLTRGLFELDPRNVDYARAHLVSLNYVVDADSAAGRLDDARKEMDRLLQLARDTHRRAPANARATDDLLGVLAQGVKLAILRGDREGARERLHEAQALGPAAKAASPARRLDVELLSWWLARDAAAIKDSAARAAESVKKLTGAGEALKPDLMLRYEAQSGHLDAARQWARKLTDAESQDPFLKSFCRSFPVCAAPASASSSPASANP